jgi:thioredoxin reductase (NADPH)
VVVAGAGGWANAEAKELVGLAGTVTVIGAAGDESPAEIPRITGRIVGLEGSDGLHSVIVDAEGGQRTVPANAVFVYVGQSPAAEFLPDSLARDGAGHIVVDAEGRTSAAMVLAVGDVRAGARALVSDAIADGQRAAQAVVSALKKS